MSSLRPGPDPNFPYLNETDYFSFSDPETWDDDIIAIGGNLSPGMVLSAYEQGIFPWYNPGDPVLWQSPDPRCILFPEKLHISDSMKKVFKKGVFEIKFDTDFLGVINGCAQTVRKGQSGGTWISKDIIEAYYDLHLLGWTHCAEAWHEGELVGGCYGTLMGRAFFGESMFSRKPNASKAAFITLAQTLFKHGVAFVDCQVPTKHLATFGSEVVPRKDFLALLREHNISRKRAAD
jgi:leucyl/phenylalanyl-tRNA--protein transferase